MEFETKIISLRSAICNLNPSASRSNALLLLSTLTPLLGPQKNKHAQCFDSLAFATQSIRVIIRDIPKGLARDTCIKLHASIAAAIDPSDVDSFMDMLELLGDVLLYVTAEKQLTPISLEARFEIIDKVLPAHQTEIATTLGISAIERLVRFPRLENAYHIVQVMGMKDPLHQHSICLDLVDQVFASGIADDINTAYNEMPMSAFLIAYRRAFAGLEDKIAEVAAAIAVNKKSMIMIDWVANHNHEKCADPETKYRRAIAISTVAVAAINSID